MRDISPYEDTYLYIELWCYIELEGADVGISRPEPEILGWTIL
jgi:hypothetical protein